MLPVVLLCGGLATRMRPKTEKIPKAMLEIANKPFIYHQLNLLKKKGVRQVIICLGHLGKMIEDYVGCGNDFGLSVTYSYDGEKLLGTGGAIKKAKQHLNGPFFVLYGDSYLITDYRKVEKAYESNAKKGLMAVYKNEGRWDTSNVVFKNNEIIVYSKRNKLKEMNYIDYGIGVLSMQALGHETGDVFDLADVYERLAEEKQLAGYEVFERFYEIGSNEGFMELTQKFEEWGEL